MPAYLVFSYDVIDPAKYEEYVKGVGPLLLSKGGEVLVVDDAAKYLEGQGRGVNVVIRFDSQEAALEFYNSDEYEPLKALRISSTTGTCLFADGFIVPSHLPN